jgi:hypothetical protein
MGTKMTPFANIFIGRLEKQILLLAPTKSPTLLWIIYNIGMMGSKERKVSTILSFVNSFHRSIKFTVDISDVNNTFLVIIFTLINSEIEFDLHIKSPSSCHPKGCTKGPNNSHPTNMFTPGVLY